MVLYAYNLFILNWLRPRIDPIIKDKKELNNNTFFHEYSNDVYPVE